MRPARPAVGCSCCPPLRRRGHPCTAEAAQEGFQGPRRDVLPGVARGRYVEDLEAEAERRLEPHRDVRFPCAARDVEDVRDVDLRFWGHAPQDGRDEHPVSPVGQDGAARLPRVGVALDAGEPREGFRRTRHQPGVGLEDPHPGAAVAADRRDQGPPSDKAVPAPWRGVVWSSRRSAGDQASRFPRPVRPR